MGRRSRRGRIGRTTPRFGCAARDTSPAAREVFDAANDTLRYDLKSLCFAGPEEELNKTNVSQPAIYVTGVACYRAAVAAGVVRPDEVTAYAGLSLGEYTALVFAGALTFADGLRVVAKRGQAMQAAVEAHRGSQ